MKRKIIWSLVAFAALATLSVLWFLDNFEQVPTTHWEAAEKEARRNPFLALEHVFAQLGRPVVRVKSPAALDSLPAGGVLILDGNRRHNVNPARADRILKWVENGGYLIVAAEYVGDDPLLSKLGVSRHRSSACQCKASKTQHPEEDAKEDDDEVVAVKKKESPKTPSSFEFKLPGSDTFFRMGQSGSGLTSALPEPAWRAGLSDEQSTLVHYAQGKGQISVVDNLRPFMNIELVKHDHAELIWALLRQYQPQGEIRLASRMEVPTLWEWLAESAWMALISTTVLIGLWLWRIIPRFGGLLPTPVGERRDLVQHLSAIGRSVWREGGMEHWLTIVRQAINKRISLRHPYLFRMATQEQRSALARIADCRSRAIKTALTPGQARTPDEFTEAMQTLQRLDQRL